MSDTLLKQTIDDILSRDSEDLPEGARELVVKARLSEVAEERRPKRSFFFLRDWKRDA